MSILKLASAPLLLAGSAFGQSFNIDCGANIGFPTPDAAYGAGSGQAGTWNSISAPATSTPLTDTTGAATGVTMTEVGSFGDFEFDNAGTTGDDNNLLDDCFDVGGLGGSSTVTISGLADGNYTVYTYSWAPDNRVDFRTDVDVAGSASGPQTVGGIWSGMHDLGITYALHDVSVSGGSDIVITLNTNTGFGSLNGMQIVPSGGPTSYCAPANANSISANGAVLTSTGGFGTSTATFDIVDVPDQPGILFAGDTTLDLPFGCGRRCVGGTIIRGSVVLPMGNQALGQTFDMSAATSVNIQYWYRDPANSGICGAPFNLSNALMP